MFIAHPVTSLTPQLLSLWKKVAFPLNFVKEKGKFFFFSGEERFDLFCHKRNFMAVRSVKVSNVSLGASEQDMKEFFSFSGEIEHVEMQSGNERSQIAYVTFKDSQGAETAVLLSGATIVDQSVIIDLAPDYKPPATASAPPATMNKSAGQAESAVQKAEDVVSSMLARGFILGKDAVTKAKAFDEKHQFTSTATAKVASLDQKIGLTEKISAGTTMVNDKVREMDQKFQVSEKTKSAFAAAEQTVSSAGSAIMKNRYVLTGASWVTGAFNRVAKAAGDVGQKTKEKVMAEEEQAHKSEGYAQINESEPPKAATSEQPSKPSSAQGLIL
ncbi:PREDICTED: binding partner of ACD11 1 [Theobroma cacao]|uniref:Binding partner of ACD11 1 n=1 Tax=Theobroma cacao TaxID=3641 RepID=A0AB32V5P9_THECC|nr:PREDICTED: binding partner of ACD11 1 [Theobroma cacao]